MTDIPLYKTFSDYGTDTGVNQLLYPLRDSITVVNPFLVILFGLLFVLTAASYYTQIQIIGNQRFFNSLLAGSFAVSVVSMFFALAGLITPYGVLLMIAISTIALILTIFYR